MFFLMLVLNDSEKLEAILDAWDEVGVSGVTILPSTGMARYRESGALRDDLPLIPSLEDLVEHEERLNRTLITVVPNDEMVDKVLKATQDLIGDLNLPNTGIMAVIPLARGYGLDKKDSQQDEGSCR